MKKSRYCTLFTDLGSLIGNKQCGNFRISLPLRFYVKSILVIFEAPKIAILTILEALNFEYLEIFDTFIDEIPKNQHSKPTKRLKWQFFDLLKSAKMNFT